MWSRCRLCCCRCRWRPAARSTAVCAPRPSSADGSSSPAGHDSGCPCAAGCGMQCCAQTLAGPPQPLSPRFDLTRFVAMAPPPALRARRPIGRSQPANPARAARRLTSPSPIPSQSVHSHAALDASARCIVRRPNMTRTYIHCRRRCRAALAQRAGASRRRHRRQLENRRALGARHAERRQRRRRLYEDHQYRHRARPPGRRLHRHRQAASKSMR